MQWKAWQFLKFRLAKDFCIRILATLSTADVAQLVEHHVANVIVDGSNPFTRSILRQGFGRAGRFPLRRNNFYVFDEQRG